MKDIGWTILAEFLFLFFAGYFMDLHWGTGYVWTLTGIALAFVMIGYEIWKLTKK